MFQSYDWTAILEELRQQSKGLNLLFTKLTYVLLTVDLLLLSRLQDVFHWIEGHLLRRTK
jgi:hypothetical protein